MKKFLGIFLMICVMGLMFPLCTVAQEYQLVWCDEFNTDGRLADASWNYE